MAGYGTVLIVRKQSMDRFGDLAGQPVDTTYGGWDIAPASSIEDVGSGRTRLTSRNAVSTDLVAYGGPAEHDIRAEDRVYLAADDRSGPPPWQVLGDPGWWAAPGWGGASTGQASCVVTLQRTTG